MKINEITKAEKPGYIHRSWVDIEGALSRITKKQKIQAECDAAEEVWVKKILKDVDKAIIEDMRKTHPEYFNS